MLRYPSLRRPLDILFLVCCIALTADVLVPEIWGNGKTKDYPLWFWAGQQVLLLVNGMGATPLSELSIVYGRARSRLQDAGLEVHRSLVGNYVTALDMQGASVSVLRLDPELTALFDAPVITPALRWGA